MLTERSCPRKEAVRLAVEEADQPFTAAQLWRRCRELHPGISRATVYRQLKRLREEGMIKDIVLPHGLHLSVRAEVEGCCITECEDCGLFRMCSEFAEKVASGAVNTPVIPSHTAIYLRGRCREQEENGACLHRTEEALVKDAEE